MQSVASSVYIDLGIILSFSGDIDEQQKTDVLYSTLFAQLAADKQVVTRDSDPQSWYKQYLTVLGQVGWSTGSFAFNEYASKTTTIALSDVISDVVQQHSSDAAVSQVVSAVKEIAADAGDDTRYQSLDNIIYADGHGNVQVGVVSNEPPGTLTMFGTLISFQTVTSETPTNILGHRFAHSNIRIQSATTTSTLNTATYDQFREQIAQRLQAAGALKFITPLDVR